MKRPAKHGKTQGSSRRGRKLKRPGKSAGREAERPLIRLTTRALRGGRGVGFAARVCLVEAGGKSLETVSAGKEHVQVGKATVGRTDTLLGQAGRKVGRGVALAHVGEVFAAAGSEHRLKIMLYLLEGPATYQGLQNATGLAVGPLYHHVSKLRLAGLMAPKERDLYTLTRAGRNLILLAMAGAPLLKDRRLRAQPRE